MDVWLGAENLAGTVYEYCFDHLFPVLPPPTLLYSADMMGELESYKYVQYTESWGRFPQYSVLLSTVL
jgi:hypothetical protein